MKKIKVYKKGIHADNEDRKFFNFVWKENLFQTQMKNISNALVSYRRPIMNIFLNY